MEKKEHEWAGHMTGGFKMMKEWVAGKTVNGVSSVGGSGWDCTQMGSRQTVSAGGTAFCAMYVRRPWARSLKSRVTTRARADLRARERTMNRRTGMRQRVMK